MHRPAFASRAALLALTASLAATVPARAQRTNELLAAGEAPALRLELPPGTRVFRDVAYGPDPAQRFDVYAPARASGAPVVFMVHGGGWRRGDKAGRSVVENKVRRWVAAGFVVISTNYRMLPEADPLEQARDVARAVATAQRQAAAWGADRNRFILMGHSAGAHLVALIASAPALYAGLQVTPWIGVVILDSAALDVVETMEGRHFRLHDQAFGTDRAFWESASPYHALDRAAAPMLAICSTRRTTSCEQARRFVSRAVGFGTRAAVLLEDLSHREINAQLGLPGDYTTSVEAFMGSLDPVVGRALERAPATPGHRRRGSRRGR